MELYLSDDNAFLTVIAIGDGTGGMGVIESVSNVGEVGTTPGLHVMAENTFTLGTVNQLVTLNFENSDNVTYLLVEGFSGDLDLDLDTDDDCVLDSTPWTRVHDVVASIVEVSDPLDTGPERTVSTRAAPISWAPTPVASHPRICSAAPAGVCPEPGSWASTIPPSAATTRAASPPATERVKVRESGPFGASVSRVCSVLPSVWLSGSPAWAAG